MNNTSSNNIRDIHTFSELCKSWRIRIPKIQRDYVQGRKTSTVDDIRKNFVRSLLLVVKGKESGIKLDFIYGSQQVVNSQNAFEPLDGQQRLTTLFLLHWILNVACVKTEDDKAALTYITRATTEEFCDELVHHTAINYILEAKENVQKNQELKSLASDNRQELNPDCLKEETISGIIKDRNWFKWSWRFDPSVLSMLVMIDEIIKSMGDDFDWTDTNAIGHAQDCLDNITFDFKELEDLGMSDDLYIKMNARGKQLGAFDKMKSTLEEEIQLQKAEEHDAEKLQLLIETEKQWRGLMDGNWVDLFWKKYASNTMVEHATNSDEDKKARIIAARQVETYMMRLILRLIGMQLFAKSGETELRSRAERLNADVLNDMFIAYQDQLANWRSDKERSEVPNDIVRIDFQQLIEDIQHLIVLDAKGESEDDITAKFSHLVSWDGDKKDISYFQLLVDEKFPRDLMAMWYGLILFLRKHPGNGDARHISLLEDWTRFSRNLLSNNNNNDLIDKEWKLVAVVESLQQLIDENFNTNVTDVPLAISRISKTYKQIDNASLKEEIEKTKLYASGETNDANKWRALILKAQANEYLWGQIRALLDWSKGDLTQFEIYEERLSQLIHYGKDPNETGWYMLFAAMHAYNENAWRADCKLFEFNKGRYHSVKRCLRSDNANNTKGAIYKEFIDGWIADGNKTIKDYCEGLVLNIAQSDIKNWVWAICQNPCMIYEKNQKHIMGELKGHVIMAEGYTLASKCHDSVLVYICQLIDEQSWCPSYESRQENDSPVKLVYYCAHTDFPFRVVFSAYDHDLYIEWDKGETGGYRLVIDKNEDKESLYAGAKDMINEVEQRLLPLMESWVKNQGVSRDEIKAL